MLDHLPSCIDTERIAVVDVDGDGRVDLVGTDVWCGRP
jgi:hypothetical protein